MAGSGGLIRPEPPPSDYPDLAWVAVAEGSDWRLATSGRQCSLVHGSPLRVRCPNLAAAELNRPTRTRYRAWDAPPVSRWWAYCPEHMYGRWVEDGQVMHWILRPVG